MWPRQESNLDLELRKLLYYPLYYEAKIGWKMLRTVKAVQVSDTTKAT